MDAKHFLDNFKDIKQKLEARVNYVFDGNDTVGGQCIAALVCEEYWGVPQKYDIPVIAGNSSYEAFHLDHIEVPRSNFEPYNLLFFAPLNCLAIYANLLSDKLYYSNEFVYFLESQQLEINYPEHPSRAALQFLTYSQYFNIKDKQGNVRKIYVDIDKQIYEFIYPIILDFPRAVTPLNFADFKLYLQCRELCHKYFLISQNTYTSLLPTCLSPKRSIYNLNDWMEFIYVYKSLNKPGVKKNLKETLTELLPYKNLRKDLTKEYVSNLPKDWKDQLKGLDKFLSDHDRLYKYFENKTLAEQLKIYRLLGKVSKGQNIWILGEIENSRVTELTEERISNLVRNKRLELNRALVAPLTLPKFKYGWEVKELNSLLLLKEEGAYNRHCVGGYSSTLRDTHRIFSIRKDGIRFTVEVETNFLDRTHRWKVIQARGNCNCTLDSYPPNIKLELQQNLDLLLEYLSKTRIKKEDDFEL